MCGSALLFLRQTYEEGAQNFTCSVMRLCCMHGVSGRYPSGQRGQTVNLLAYAFGGSNPPLPTMFVVGDAMDDVCGNSSAVERQPSKLGVAGSNPVSRSILTQASPTSTSR